MAAGSKSQGNFPRRICYTGGMSKQHLTLEQAQQLAEQLFHQQRFADAEQLCQQILQVAPQQVPTLHLLAIIATQSGRHEPALHYVAQAIQLNPQWGVLHNTQGNIFLALKHWSAAEQSYQRGLQLNPNDAALQRNLGLVYKEQREYAKAQACFAKAVSLQPGFIDAWDNLGTAYHALEEHAHALTAWQTELKLNPNNPTTYARISLALQGLARYNDALNYAQQAVQRLPLQEPAAQSKTAKLFAHVWKIQGELLFKLGKAPAALAIAERVLSWMPDDESCYRSVLWRLNFISPPPWQKIHQACQAFNRFCQAYCATLSPLQSTPRNAHARLRIGYVSADFRDHPVGYFMQPILAHHDRSRFEVYCYHYNQVYMQQTQRLQSLVEHWVDCGEFSDNAFRQRIVDDELDILVELSGVTDGNILPLIAQKLAPIQVSYLGYPNSSCLSSIDYRITDIYVSPAEQTPCGTEQRVRLPFAYHCYQPPETARDLPVMPTPALRNGFLTFASFNAYQKVSEEIFALWIQVLQQHPTSRFLMQARVLNDAATCQQIAQRFIAAGISAERLSLLHGNAVLAEHLQVYHQVDVCLDTYPYNGGTTTCNALWMGVPTLSLCGETQASRMGYSILSTAGLSAWVAFQATEFVEKARTLTADIQQLQQLRASMRERLQASPLMDTEGFTRALEQTYQKLHHHHCNQL